MHDDRPTYDHQRELALCGWEARLMAQGGLLYTEPDTLHAAVRDVLSWQRDDADLTEAEAARLAVALCRGYAITHPELDPNPLAGLLALHRALAVAFQRIGAAAQHAWLTMRGALLEVAREHPEALAELQRRHALVGP